MRKGLGKAGLKYGAVAVLGLLLTWCVVKGRNDLCFDVLTERLRVLSDGFTVSGTVIFLLGTLICLSKNGALDGISYAVGYAVRMLVPGRSVGDTLDYAAHVEHRREKGKNRECGCFLCVGSVYLLIGILFAFLFYRAL